MQEKKPLRRACAERPYGLRTASAPEEPEAAGVDFVDQQPEARSAQDAGFVLSP